MALFTLTPPCPICGAKTSFFLSTKIDGKYLCESCAEKIDVQEDIKNNLTMQSINDYLAFYEENQILKDSFIISKKLDFGCFDASIIFDFRHKQFCMSKFLDKTVFRGQELKYFIIKEDDTPLFEGSYDGLKQYPSTVPDRIKELAPHMSQFLVNMDFPEPFKAFNIELHMEHPYWEIITCNMFSPSFSYDFPDVNDYMHEYKGAVALMTQLSKALMNVAFPECGETMENVVSEYVIDEIRQYRALMKNGVITKEEFNEKKKCLLGL